VAALFTKTADTPTTSYYHVDAQGSVRAISDDSGAIVIRHDYYTFGEDAQPLTGDPLRYAGKELDPETAQEYFGARYYRNVWGRFGTVDPIFSSAAMADPQQWNRYAYARNNPLKFSDPLGATVTYDQTCPSLGAVGDDDKAPPTWVSCSGDAGGGGGSDPNLPYGQEYMALPYLDTGLVGENSNVYIVELPGGWCAEGTTPTSSYGQAYPCPVAPSPLVEPRSSTTHLSNAPSSDPPANPPGDTGGGGSDGVEARVMPVPASLLRWNSCTARALGAGLASAALDAIGLIPEMGGVARMIGHGAGYRGIVADQAGARILQAVDGSVRSLLKNPA
jgi:RHS repeat-associated protein